MISQRRISSRLGKASAVAFESLSKSKHAYYTPIKIVDKVLKIQPKNIEALLLKGNIIEMYYASLLESHLLAKSCYEKALSVDPTNISANVDMGDWFSNNREYTKSIRYYNIALRMLKKQGKKRAISEDFEEAFTGKIDALLQLGRVREAGIIAKEGLVCFPTSRMLISCLRKIQKR